MPLCPGIKRDGGRCTVVVESPKTHADHHDPDAADKRRRVAAKGGKGKPNRELQGVKDLCKDLTERVLSGELQPGPAAVANQLINTRLRAIEQERKNRETDELEERLEALEREQERGRGKRRWG
jgi:hypothetical protein